MIDPAELVDVHAVARLLGLSRRNAVTAYLRRYGDFPRPVVDLDQCHARLWLRGDIEAWTSERRRAVGDGAGVHPSGAASISVARVGSALPAPTDTFIGRDQDVARVAELLEGQRLVVVTGPSGMGKTRLAREVGGQIGSRYPDGVHFVELAATREPRLVPKAVADALRIWEQPRQPVTDTLVSQLYRRHLLVILDNCEQIIAECASLADTLLQNCPGLSILATSQVPLTIGGEALWSLAPLAVPDAGAALDVVETSAAVSLFTLRAAAASGKFSLTPRVVPVVAEICRRLDGIPLAIELAAARIAVLTPQEILARLDDRFALLTGGSRAVLARHQTLQASFDWSHDLLSPQEEVLFRRLSVFAGGFSLQSIETVCSETGQEIDVLGPLTGLVAKSLVVATTSDMEARYRLLETIQVYAAERLERSGEGDNVRRRHAEWCMAFAETAEAALTGRDQVSCLERIEQEHHNLRVGLRWTIGEQDAERALRLAGALTIFWRVRCHFKEGQEWLSSALALHGNHSQSTRARAVWGLGFMELMLGLPSAPSTLGEAIDLARASGDVRGEARGLLLRGNYARDRRDWPAALQDLEQGAQLARQTHDSWCLAHVLSILGETHFLLGDVRRARGLLEEGVEMGRRSHDQQGLRLSLSSLGLVALHEGRYADAEAIFFEALAESQNLGEPYFSAVNLRRLGSAFAAKGDFDRAHELLDLALGISRDGDIASETVRSLTVLGWLEQAQGRLGNARTYFEEARTTADSTGIAIPSALRGLGELAIAEDRWPEAEAMLNEARSATDRAMRSDRAWVISSLARLARAQGDHRRSSALFAEALEVFRRCGEVPAVVESLEEMASLARQSAQLDQAARLFGAAIAIRQAKGYARPPLRKAAFDGDLDALKQGLGSRRLKALLREGATMSMEEAAAYALKRRLARGRPQTGWNALTRSERDITSLVVKGLTNREIGAQLFVSPRTVETHLTNVFSKVGLSSRRELGKEASERGM